MLRTLLFILPFLLPLMTACSHPPKVASEQTQIRAKAQQVVPKIEKAKIASKKDFLIVLDAGHGGYDLGARCSSCNEKSLALSTTLMVKKYLTDKGYQVIMTRMRDVFIPLHQRAQMANKAKGRLFMSIHFNAAKNTTAEGIEVFYYDSADKYRTSSSKKLAQLVLSKMVNSTGAVSRGIKGGNFFVIRETQMPAILIEGGFITHEKERALLKDVQYREKIALSIAEAVESYFAF